MIRTFRAAALAVAAFALSAATGVSAPGQTAPIAAAAFSGTLEQQVASAARVETDSLEQDCLASAVYFEARGEPLKGQLAVADVVLNRVRSERYPDTICEVVEQPWQFSFVNRTGRIPNADRSSEAWSNAVAIARIALAGTARAVDSDVLWYHADYVSPSWGRRLARQDRIGLHIFYS
ncbi:MAG TPA: cell wall hydrolase [Allosphingosinicella sp.]|nr:cell wall hydrolase [Allosphingosinicella sp.]HYG31181.1 cell wall hydrolase [Allosphingosinicella sp.]